MFCPKCGTQNPEEGIFCRSCGTVLGNVSKALTTPHVSQLVDRKGKPIHLEGALKKLFTGFAFLAVAIALAVSKTGQGWWFWMLIPAFGAIGSGVAQYMQLRGAEKGQTAFGPVTSGPALGAPANSTLPPPQTEWVAPESRYKTGDLMPPSVTENTTRHLEVDSEGQTMALPKEPADQ
jgi:hypothetical protein